jgi:hypothetical protein
MKELEDFEELIKEVDENNNKLSKAFEDSIKTSSDKILEELLQSLQTNDYYDYSEQLILVKNELRRRKIEKINKNTKHNK